MRDFEGRELPDTATIVFDPRKANKGPALPWLVVLIWEDFFGANMRWTTIRFNDPDAALRYARRVNRNMSIRYRIGKATFDRVC